jgi:hypothetical protein
MFFIFLRSSFTLSAPEPAPGGGTKCTRSITVVNGGYNRCIYIKGWVKSQ